MDVDAKERMDVVQLSGLFCYSAAAMVMDSVEASAEAVDTTTTVSGSSYFFSAAAVAATMVVFSKASVKHNCIT